MFKITGLFNNELHLLISIKFKYLTFKFSFGNYCFTIKIYQPSKPANEKLSGLFS